MKPLFKPLVAALSLTFAGTATPALTEGPLFKFVDGVDTCPEDTVRSLTQLSHENGVKRMIAAGAEPIAWNVVPAELHHDHARTDTLPEVNAIFMEHPFKVEPHSTW